MESILEKFLENLSYKVESSKEPGINNHDFNQGLEKAMDLIISEINSIKEAREKDEEFKEALKETIEAIANKKIEAPVLHFEYPENMEYKDFYEWFHNMAHCFVGIARIFEQQERGSCCCVDRAWRDWIMPEVKKMWKTLKRRNKQKLLELAKRIDNLKDPDINYSLYNQGIEEARNLLLCEAEKIKKEG